MGEGSFWQGFVGSAVGAGVFSALGTWLTSRHVERVRWQEQGEAELVKLRQQAVLELARAFGPLLDARTKLLAAQQAGMRGAALEDEQRAWFKAWQSAFALFQSRIVVLPPRAARGVGQAFSEVNNAMGPAQLGSAANTLRRSLGRYMPPLKPYDRTHRTWTRNIAGSVIAALFAFALLELLTK